MLNFLRSTAFAVAVLAATAPVSADDNADANRLFVASMQAWKQAEQLTGDSLEQAKTRLELLQEIDANLNRIVKEHSASDLAVQLLLGPVGPLELDRLPALIQAAERGVEMRLVDIPVQLAMSLFSAGDTRNALAALVQAAISSAHQLEDSEGRFWVLAEVAKAQAVTGDMSGALETIYQIEDVDKQSEALRVVAQAEALGATPQIELFLSASESQSIGVVQALVVAGNASEAFMFAGEIEDYEARSVALTVVAVRQAKAGNLAAAQQIFSLARDAAEETNDGYFRSEALSAVAQAQASVGDTAGAEETLVVTLNTIQKIQDVDGRAAALVTALFGAAPLAEKPLP